MSHLVRGVSYLVRIFFLLRMFVELATWYAASATSYAELFAVVFATWYAASATSYAEFVQCLGSRENCHLALGVEVLAPLLSFHPPTTR